MAFISDFHTAASIFYCSCADEIPNVILHHQKHEAHFGREQEQELGDVSVPIHSRH